MKVMGLFLRTTRYMFLWRVVERCIGPTLKLKRPEVLRMYDDTIEAFYADAD